MTRSFAEALEIARLQRSRSLELWQPWLIEHGVELTGAADFLAMAEASGLEPDDVDDVVGLVIGQLSKQRYKNEIAELLVTVRRKAEATNVVVGNGSPAKR
jgi:hypothetical protein